MKKATFEEAVSFAKRLHAGEKIVGKAVHFGMEATGVLRSVSFWNNIIGFDVSNSNDPTVYDVIVGADNFEEIQK